MSGMSDDDGSVVSDDAPRDESDKKSGLGWGCLGIVALVIGVPVACTIAYSGAGSSDWAPSAIEARNICEDWVREQLKSPSSADFNDGSVTGAGAGPYTITGTVDAQNSFGAMLRSDWTCTIEYRADEKWHGSADVD
jgi:hypothetical protein